MGNASFRCCLMMRSPRRSHYVSMSIQTDPIVCECGSRDTCNALPTGGSASGGHK